MCEQLGISGLRRCSRGYRGQGMGAAPGVVVFITFPVVRRSYLELTQIPTIFIVLGEMRLAIPCSVLSYGCFNVASYGYERVEVV